MRLFDFVSEGIRPVVDGENCGACDLCMQVCPMVKTEFGTLGTLSVELQGLEAGWGPVLEIWEGHAKDPNIRFKGASGGVLTALSAYCLEVLGMKGVLHTAQDPEDPLRNRTRLSTSLNELIAATGSRYSPGSVCNGLGLLEQAEGACLFVGRPVEVAALRNVQRIRPELDRKVAGCFSFFCAESPSTNGTLELLKRMGVDPGEVISLRYRGEGWPGYFAPLLKGGRPPSRMSYRESWAFLQAYRPWAAHLWPDGTGELADVSCGDPWYMEPDGENPGVSLLVVRTDRGREIVKGAVGKGYVELRRAEPWKLIKSQEGLFKKKGAVWGRLLVLRILGLPVPIFKNKANLFRCWIKLDSLEKASSILGTAKRILKRKLYGQLILDPREGIPVKPAMIL